MENADDRQQSKNLGDAEEFEEEQEEGRIDNVYLPNILSESFPASSNNESLLTESFDSSASSLLLSAAAQLRRAAARVHGNSIYKDIELNQSGILTSFDHQADNQNDSRGGPRKLAFHEPRPCYVCNRVYRDAATLRTHFTIMHSEADQPFTCSCGQEFQTKYEMYNHKKGHRHQ